MSNNSIKLKKEKESVYLDTSFILNAVGNFYDKNENITSKSQEKLGILLTLNVGNCFISNITINEIFNVIEKQGFRAFIDNKIIKEIGETKENWIALSKSQKDILRQENDDKLGFNFSNIKEWRKQKYKDYYKIYVFSEFQNVMDSILSLKPKIITNFNTPQEYYKIFKENIKKFKKLDSNDLNHFLLCKENHITTIITCDYDFHTVKNEIIVDLIL